ncbi:UNVERIFIED_CONTAM: hypothetical protein RMT77_005863 [Armadillidium vulgare]
MERSLILMVLITAVALCHLKGLLPKAEGQIYSKQCSYPITEGYECSSGKPGTYFGFSSAQKKCIPFHFKGCGEMRNNFKKKKWSQFWCDRMNYARN